MATLPFTPLNLPVILMRAGVTEIVHNCILSLVFVAMKGALNAVGFLVLNYKPSLVAFLPSSLCVDQRNRIFIAFQPKTKAYRAMFTAVCYHSVSLLYHHFSQLSRSMRRNYFLFYFNQPNGETSEKCCNTQC